jgi:disintegrin and metalloproteinase domain-containing protein 10
VHGIITQDGVFEGKINTMDEQYVIEKADRYFHERQPFHSVIYRHSDVQMDTLQGSLCHSDELHRKVRQWQAEEARKRQRATAADAQEGHSHHRGTSQVVTSRRNGGDKVIWTNHRNASDLRDERQASIHDDHEHNTGYRRRRAIDPTKTTCTLYIQADHLFYKKYGRNEERVIEQLTQHVQGVNQIYSIIGTSMCIPCNE